MLALVKASTICVRSRGAPCSGCVSELARSVLATARYRMRSTISSRLATMNSWSIEVGECASSSCDATWISSLRFHSTPISGHKRHFVDNRHRSTAFDISTQVILTHASRRNVESRRARRTNRNVGEPFRHMGGIALRRDGTERGVRARISGLPGFSPISACPAVSISPEGPGGAGEFLGVQLSRASHEARRRERNPRPI